MRLVCTVRVQNAEVELINLIVMIFLLFETYEDIKFHSISLNSLVCFGVTGIIVDLFYDINIEIFCGFIIGTGIILLSIIFNGTVGLGDGMLFIILGIYLGGRCFKLFIHSLFIASVVSVIMLLSGKNHRYEIPFVPCVLIAYMEVMLFEI